MITKTNFYFDCLLPTETTVTGLQSSTKSRKHRAFYDLFVKSVKHIALILCRNLHKNGEHIYTHRTNTLTVLSQRFYSGWNLIASTALSNPFLQPSQTNTLTALSRRFYRGGLGGDGQNRCGCDSFWPSANRCGCDSFWPSAKKHVPLCHSDMQYKAGHRLGGMSTESSPCLREPAACHYGIELSKITTRIYAVKRVVKNIHGACLIMSAYSQRQKVWLTLWQA